MIMQKSGRSNLVRFGLLVSAFPILVSCGNSRKTYVLTGRIISKLPSKQLLIINNDDIPGFMPAMTMDYKVADGQQIAGLKPGDTICADLVVNENIGHLEKIAVQPKAVPPSPPAATPVK